MACPSAVVRGEWCPDGLSHQEAPQADGEEEAPQAAEEDADPAQEQEIGPAGPVRLAVATAVPCRYFLFALAPVSSTRRPGRANSPTMVKAARPTPRAERT